LEGLTNYIYEVQKGTKPMALVTLGEGEKAAAIDKIEKSGLAYALQKIEDKVNIFFGKAPCIELVSKFLHKKLNELSAQEDFILGILLGYCRVAQCERYLNRELYSLKQALQ
jgi:hypothetical protein